MKPANGTVPAHHAPKVGLLALQGDVREHAEALARLGCSSREVREAADLERVEALIIPGGESTTISLLLRTSGLLEPLRRRLEGGMPAFGTCAGMIILAGQVIDGRDDQVALGAIDLSVRRNAYGRQVDSFETDLEVAGLDDPFHAVFIRAPSVETAGSDVEVLAELRDPSGRSRPVLCRQGAVLVAAFHPELSGDSRLHRRFLDLVASGALSATASRP